MKLQFNNSRQIFSVLITLVIYIIILVLLSFIYLEQSSKLKKREVFVEFREFEKEAIKQLELPKIKKGIKSKIVTEKINRAVIEESSLTIESEISINSNLILQNDSLETKFNWLDSLVVANPNLQLLKYASDDYIKKNPILKSDSAKVAEGIRNFMQDYYKSKYPTPVYKFGDGSPGFAIDKIINLFRSDDVDEEKIKKYLKIGKYNKK